MIYKRKTKKGYNLYGDDKNALLIVKVSHHTLANSKKKTHQKIKKKVSKKNRGEYSWITPSTPKSKIPKTLLREAKKKGGIVIQRSKHTEMVAHHNLKLDHDFPALPPGKRLSRNGHVYYEYRVNRTDKRKWL